MSKQSGLFVFTATPELAQAMPKIFRSGSVYTVQRADTVIQTAPGTGPGRRAGGSVTPSAKKLAKKDTKPTGKSQAAKLTKVPAQKAAPKVIKGGKRSASPESVVQFVRENDGCNMTQIEAATRMAQPDIRKALNDAREAGQIRTEGQRRGLRYFAVAASASAAASSDKPNATASGNPDSTW